MTAILVAMLPTVALVLIALVALPLLDRRYRATRIGLAVVGTTLVAQYLAWRIIDTMPPLAFSAPSLYAWIYLPFDVAYCSMLIFLFVILTRSSNTASDSDRLRASTEDQATPPLVDVLIPTYNEDLEILEPTIVGVLAMTHPRTRVWVLDDGRRPWLRDYCARRGVHYLDRPNNEHAKAGNMNNGLAAIAKETEQPDFIAVFDADFVPTPLFLTRTLPLFKDKDVGLVQTPQHFYSDGPIQMNLGVASWWLDEQRQHFDTLLPARDAWVTAFCCGTSSVVRYEALLKIGGFPTESVTEDYLTSLKLRCEGWRTAYLNERLSHGLAPAGVAEYVGQRARWCLGTMQILRSAWGPFTRRALPFLVRLNLLDHAGYWGIYPIMRIVNLCVPIVYWFTGVFVMETDVTEALLRFAPFFAGVHILIAWQSAGRNLPILNDVNHTLMAFDVARAAIVGLTRPKGHKFRVTLKRAVNDRIIVHGQIVRTFMAFATLHVLGIAVAALTGIGPSLDDGPLPLVAFWTIINLVVIGLAALACVERPRRRLYERFTANEPASAFWSGSWSPVTVKELSLIAARFQTPSPPAVGTPIMLDMPDVGRLEARVNRSTGRGAVSASFALDGAERDAMIRKLFSGRYGMAPEEIGLRTTLRAMGVWLVGRLPTRVTADEPVEAASVTPGEPADAGAVPTLAEPDRSGDEDARILGVRTRLR